MINIREKLVELFETVDGVCPSKASCYECPYENMGVGRCSLYTKADYFIANGVTVQDNSWWFEMVESKLDEHTGEYWEEVYYNCSNCDYASDWASPFCPACGKPMLPTPQKGE